MKILTYHPEKNRREECTESIPYTRWPIPFSPILRSSLHAHIPERYPWYSHGKSSTADSKRWVDESDTQRCIDSKSDKKYFGSFTDFSSTSEYLKGYLCEEIEENKWCRILEYDSWLCEFLTKKNNTECLSELKEKKACPDADNRKIETKFFH